jgi:hypothetical protein
LSEPSDHLNWIDITQNIKINFIINYYSLLGTKGCNFLTIILLHGLNICMQMPMPSDPGPLQYNYKPSVYKLPQVKLKDWDKKITLKTTI